MKCVWDKQKVSKINRLSYILEVTQQKEAIKCISRQNVSHERFQNGGIGMPQKLVVSQKRLLRGVYDFAQSYLHYGLLLCSRRLSFNQNSSIFCQFWTHDSCTLVCSIRGVFMEDTGLSYKIIRKTSKKLPN